MKRTLTLLNGVILASALAFAQIPALETYPLPATVAFPEGIAHDAAAGVVYTANAENGAVVRMNLSTKAVDTVAAPGVLFPGGATPAFPAALGMKVDGGGRLWIAGGRTGKLLVLDTRSGRLIKSLTVPDPAASLLNDVAIVGNAAYITDTRVPTLWRVQVTGNEVGALEPWLNFNGTALQYDPAINNLNGIAATPDGRSLIVVHMGKGLLYRIDIAAKTIHPIDTAGEDLSGADGLVLDGRNLFIVRQTAVEMVTVRLSPDLARGNVEKRFKHSALAWPATAAKVGDRLIVVNTQFNARAINTATRPFTLASVPIAQLMP
jgi:Cu-Zn family superoxide dismutase